MSTSYYQSMCLEHPRKGSFPLLSGLSKFGQWKVLHDKNYNQT